MCECQNVKSFFACPDEFTNLFSFDFEASNNFPHYFREESPTYETTPSFDYSRTCYQCSECQQWWYFECSPTEDACPILGIKLNAANHLLSEQEVKAVKQFLAVLSHAGFSAEKCIRHGCTNLSLKKIKLCVNHFI
ncbi:hypothetical protein NDN11_12085 [Acinetobacter sp. C26M]|uniref:hypothetical protein n=1 Tax=unclassified Acinetobacter TaxID=196816 RepID=UPI0014204CA8|nr:MULTISPECIES: hypothetical protein [unclassified Acinetobacter]NIE96946.1 hypothetical protein [Acinetobacter sp. Tr-809]USA45454.1 hypothetical protein NDN11_12085 [Acinetobacter sp. C26M]USA48956.1 hypothetical protein NDN12_12085 [Acinetobacter sp. C26G]